MKPLTFVLAALVTILILALQLSPVPLRCLFMECGQ